VLQENLLLPICTLSFHTYNLVNFRPHFKKTYFSAIRLLFLSTYNVCEILVAFQENNNGLRFFHADRRLYGNIFSNECHLKMPPPIFLK